MPLLPGQLARQRARARLDLTERCTIERSGPTRDNTGEWQDAWGPQWTDVPCRVVSRASLSVSERIRLDAMGQVTDWQVVVPTGYAIKSTDRITVTGGESTGRVFSITEVLAPHTDAIRVICQVQETRGGT